MRAAYERAMREVEALDHSRQRAKQSGDRILPRTVRPHWDYERSIHADTWPALDPRDALHELMALKNITQAEVGQCRVR